MVHSIYLRDHGHVVVFVKRQFRWVEHLPDQHTETPHVRRGREAAIADALWRHPPNGTGNTVTGGILRQISGDLPEKTEIGHFADFVCSDQHIPRCQVLSHPHNREKCETR